MYLVTTVPPVLLYYFVAKVLTARLSGLRYAVLAATWCAVGALLTYWLAVALSFGLLVAAGLSPDRFSPALWFVPAWPGVWRFCETVAPIQFSVVVVALLLQWTAWAVRTLPCATERVTRPTAPRAHVQKRLRADERVYGAGQSGPCPRSRAVNAGWRRVPGWVRELLMKERPRNLGARIRPRVRARLA